MTVILDEWLGATKPVTLIDVLRVQACMNLPAAYAALNQVLAGQAVIVPFSSNEAAERFGLAMNDLGVRWHLEHPPTNPPPGA